MFKIIELIWMSDTDREGEVYTVWFAKWKRTVLELERLKSEKAEGNAGLGGSVCMAHVPRTQWQAAEQDCPPPGRGWGHGRPQFIAHSEIKISPN